MKLTKGKKIALAYFIFVVIIWLIGYLVGAWEISEICAVEGVGCPESLYTTNPFPTYNELHR